MSAEGGDQARRLWPLLHTLAPEVCFCSPLLRARQTAEVILKNLHLPVHTDDDLREIDFGAWECKTFEEVVAADARAVKRWAEFDQRFTFPGGESLGGFLARIRRMARRLANDPASTVLAVTHGGVIRMMICHFLGLRPRNYVLFDVAHASCAVIDLFDGKGVLTGLNLGSQEGP
jgi:broad specificity phosphatase PhoE